MDDPASEVLDNEGDDLIDSPAILPSASSDHTAEPSIAWKEYEHLSGLYCFYLELVLKTSVAYFLMFGTITTVVLANTTEQSTINWALIPLIAVGALISGVSLRSVHLVDELRSRINDLASQLGVGLAPHVRILRSGTVGLGAMAAVTAVTLIVLFLVLQL